MSYDYPRLFDVILDITAKQGSHTSRMHRLIDECAHQKPHADWEAMRQIDFERDVLRAEDWIRNAWQGITESSGLRGIWFGLNNPGRGDRYTADLYVAASTAFDSASIDWAYDRSRALKPTAFESHALDEIYVRAYGAPDGLGNDAEYPLVLAYGAMLALAAIEFVDARLLAEPAGAVVGFDSGDLLYLGTFSRKRFVQNIVVG